MATTITEPEEAVTFVLSNGAEVRVSIARDEFRDPYVQVMQVGPGTLAIEPQAANSIRIFAPGAKPPRTPRATCWTCSGRGTNQDGSKCRTCGGTGKLKE